MAEADANAKALIAHGVPTKVVWFCGGQGACLSTTNGGVLVKRATMDWLNRYVKGDSVPLEMVAQTLKPGETVTLQLLASAFPYETITSPGVLNMSSMRLSLPTANAAAISTPSAAESTSAA